MKKSWGNFEQLVSWVTCVANRGAMEANRGVICSGLTTIKCNFWPICCAIFLLQRS